jgi:WD40 repeat protein
MVNFMPQFSFNAHDGGVTSASFAPDAQLMATGGYDSRIRLWNTKTWQEIESFPGHYRGNVTFLPGSNCLVSTGLQGGALVYDTQTWRIEKTLEDLRGVESSAIVPGKQQIGFIQPDETSEISKLASVQLWDTGNWQIIRCLELGIENVNAICFSPDGLQSALSGEKGVVSIWSENFSNKSLEFVAHDKATWTLKYSPDGKILVTGGADNVVRLWETSTWKVVQQLLNKEFDPPLNYKNGVLCSEFSPDGRTLVTGGLDGIISIWNVNALS